MKFCKYIFRRVPYVDWTPNTSNCRFLTYIFCHEMWNLCYYIVVKSIYRFWKKTRLYFFNISKNRPALVSRVLDLTRRCGCDSFRWLCIYIWCVSTHARMRYLNINPDSAQGKPHGWKHSGRGNSGAIEWWHHVSTVTFGTAEKKTKNDGSTIRSGKYFAYP